MALKPLSINLLPAPLPLKKLIGPSFIFLGLGLGSGEIILWPYLTANYGMGIIWAALLGITFQFFMNMEIERYALVHGESVFVGLARKLKYISFWFLLSTFIPWIWPGIIASSAKLFGATVGITDTTYLTIILLVVIGLILSFGPVLYKTVESFQKILIGIGVPTIFALSVILAEKTDFAALGKGAVGIGDGYMFFPEGIVMASFLAAFAYAGAGGNLNLAQSFYVREKGYGMGKYAGRITSLFTGKSEEVSLTGSRFEVNEESLASFKQWWRNINIEHFVIFWVTGGITIALLGLLSYTTVFGLEGNKQGIGFVINEGKIIGEKLFPFAGTFFLIVGGLMLFGTQLTVFDATSRILSENIVISAHQKLSERNIPKVYYIVLWLQILAGVVILLLGFTEPLALLVTAAMLNAVAMFVHIGLTLWLNSTSIDKALRPSLVRKSAMLLAFLFYGGFSAFVVYDRFIKPLF
ncbi:MAG: Nramp family divalent metal transporter [Candidatus Levybacteria bacterium]|nr:Nramp family divalent metal transporter [Candidatus Levybacteria bacterium]